MNEKVKKVLEVAKKEVGYHEGKSGAVWNNHQKYSPEVPTLEWSQNQAWCATFQSWVAMKAGVSEYYPRTASTDLGAAWFKAKNQWSEYPAVGALGYLGVNGDMYHVFLVTRFDDDYVYTVEGNTNNNGSSQGDGVYELKRPRRSSSIQGYGYPKFPEPLISADPSYDPPKPPVVKETKIAPVDRALEAFRGIRKKAIKNGKVRRVEKAQKQINQIKQIWR